MESAEILQKLLYGQTEILKKLNAIDAQICDINISNGPITKDAINNLRAGLEVLNTQQFYQDCKLRELEIATATDDSILLLQSSVQLLNNRLFQQETQMKFLEMTK